MVSAASAALDFPLQNMSIVIIFRLLQRAVAGRSSQPCTGTVVDGADRTKALLRRTIASQPCFLESRGLGHRSLLVWSRHAVISFLGSAALADIQLHRACLEPRCLLSETLRRSTQAKANCRNLLTSSSWLRLPTVRSANAASRTIRRPHHGAVDT